MEGQSSVATQITNRQEPSTTGRFSDPEPGQLIRAFRDACQ